ncbi:MAG: ferritin-like domain-containing protein [Kofleriaceae bacterium]
MDGRTFVETLEAAKATRLAALVEPGRVTLADAPTGDAATLLRVALANELGVSELAAAWMASTPEVDVKLAFARQAGDEASHFQLVATRLAALGVDVDAFTPPPDNPLFGYLKGLTTTVERIAAGLVTLESIAYGVNLHFMAYCAARGDHETVRIYEAYIQPDERAHQALGQTLLAKYATTPAQQQTARAAMETVLDLATAARAQAAARLGVACLPGC